MIPAKIQQLYHNCEKVAIFNIIKTGVAMNDKGTLLSRQGTGTCHTKCLLLNIKGKKYISTNELLHINRSFYLHNYQLFTHY